MIINSTCWLRPIMPQSFRALSLTSGKRTLGAEDQYLVTRKLPVPGLPGAGLSLETAFPQDRALGVHPEQTPGQGMWPASCSFLFTEDCGTVFGRDARRGFACGELIIPITRDNRCWALVLEANARWAGEILNRRSYYVVWITQSLVEEGEKKFNWKNTKPQCWNKKMLD